ncbi:MAG: T9SS type A sorting domain-containing protein [Bacteroidales bacterium]|nr:T9SS type A sorting domain-containing protein [Bacteroidales bacterium]
MKTKLLLLFICSFSIVHNLFSQFTLPFGFEKSFLTQVFDEQGNIIPNAWNGGLYAVQFGEADLDYDGINDLVVFDRYGNRILTYKNLGVAGQISYQFNPGLSGNLPHFDDWVIFTDYNMDGLNDIFTYSKGFAGIKVYRNNGPEATDQFELVVSPYLTSFQGSGYVNILTTYVDYPAIVDIDDDGDLDILTFWGLGSFVELHTNESMEHFGVPDSLIYRKTENCWGRFAESDESNQLYLDTCFAFRREVKGKDMQAIISGSGLQRNEFRHTGSTFLVFDENGDGLDDLLLGDVDFSAPALLTNWGTPDEALIGVYTFNWPAYDVPVDLMSFPLMAFIDVNNNGKKDLIASVFDPSLIKSENLDNIWYYENVSQTNAPEFRLRTKCFLQDEMLDFGAGAAPVFFDYNRDGLADILVGNFGYLDSCFYGAGLNLNCLYRGQLALLQNVGTAGSPKFKLIDKNFANLPGYFPKGESPFALVPAIADLDGDGDEDLLVGNAWGNLLFFENIASSGQPADFVLAEENYQSIYVDSYSAPQLFDLTGNGLPDLVVGKRNGTITFFQNTGTAENPVFTFITDSLGRVDVRNPDLSIYGHCIPHFFRDKDGNTRLFAGSEFGEIHYYTGIDNNLDGQFDLVMKNYLWIDEGLRSTVAVANLNSDDYLDMIVGNYSGGLSFFQGTLPPPAGILKPETAGFDIRIFPNPVTETFMVEMVEKPGFTLQPIRLTIFDLTGRAISSLQHSSDKAPTIDASTIPAGIYFLQIQFDKNANQVFQQVLKFVKL